MARLLMIDDDARLASMVRDYLAASGFDVDVAGDIAGGMAALQAEPPELLILDLMLPDGDGLDVCRRLRADGHTLPILMLTAKGDPIERVIGLEIEWYLTRIADPQGEYSGCPGACPRCTRPDAGRFSGGSAGHPLRRLLRFRNPS